MSIPTYIEIQTDKQCEEMRSFLKERGASISIINQDHLPKNVKDIIDHCDLLFNQDEVEYVLNSIITLMIHVQPSDPLALDLVSVFCKKLVSCEKTNLDPIFIRVLTNLREGVGQNRNLQFEVYFALVQIAGRMNIIDMVFSDLNRVRSQFGAGAIPAEKYQSLLRILHEHLLKSRRSDLAAQVMVDLLGTYTEETASQATKDAEKCIVSSLGDPNAFLLDHLLALKPVKFLEGELIHQLLTIFVSDKLPAYQAFYLKNKAVVDGYGLNHEQNLRKIRLLTFMQMAENKKEITFDTIVNDLQLDKDVVEFFIIDVLKTKLVNAKIDQLGRKVNISSTMHRTFGKPQWIQLKETLTLWKENLQKVNKTINVSVQHNNHHH